MSAQEGNESTFVEVCIVWSIGLCMGHALQADLQI
ncbi:MAG: DUF2180 family protein [Methanosarcinales archaeon]|nr:DUF2180 family protein [Methanosarcinales archaeon]